jgi:hypothetical protein
MSDGIQDYTCVLTKRERVDGRLLESETLVLKIRHASNRQGAAAIPFSAYVKFLAPESVRRREVIYVDGRNDGRLIVRNGGTRFDYITTTVPPDSPAAMQRNRYPISEIGMMNLTRRLMEQGRKELQYGDVRVETIPGDAENGARINGRPCTMIRFAHTTRKEAVPYQYVVILVDDALQLPVHYASYDWPDQEDGPSKLLEQYTYTRIQLNVGLSDWDFDHRNEDYGFLKSFDPLGTTRSGELSSRPGAARRSDGATAAVPPADRP